MKKRFENKNDMQFEDLQDEDLMKDIVDARNPNLKSKLKNNP